MFPLLVLWPFAHIRWHSSGPYDWPKSAVCLYLEKPASTKLRIDNSVGGIVHALKSGCRWCDCPAEYGPATTIITLCALGTTRRLGKSVPGAC